MAIPDTQSRVWYSYTISTTSGMEIGTLQGFDVSATMDIERVREILYSRGAKVRELVPGKVDIRATVERVMLYTATLFEAFGYPVYTIEDVLDPFTIVETGYSPRSGTTVIYYKNCLFSDYGKRVSVGTVLVNETATIQISTISGSPGPA